MEQSNRLHLWSWSALSVAFVFVASAVWEFVIEPAAPISPFDVADETFGERAEFVAVATISAIVAQTVLVPVFLRIRRQKFLADNRFKLAVENMSHGLCFFDQQMRLVVSNNRFNSMFNLTQEQTMPGIPALELLDTCMAAEPREMVTCDAVTESADAIHWLRNGSDAKKIEHLPDGREIELTRHGCHADGWLLTIEDVTNLRQMEKKLMRLAHHDALTGLPNRTMWCKRLEEEIARLPQGNRFAMLCLDLDGFKAVNDALGHAAGDQLLEEVADRLRCCVHESDIVARLGGDEFAIMAAMTGSEAPDQMSEIEALAREICYSISKPFMLDDHEVMVTTSIGIAVAPDDSSDPDQLLKHADFALYQVKHEGRGTYRIFEAGLKQALVNRRALGLDLRSAIANDAVNVFYQPLVNIENNVISSMEALARWDHPELGPISPSEFIAIAEETGVIHEFGKSIINQACAEAMSWPAEVCVSVNISPVQFRRGGLLETIQSALEASGLPPSRFEIEITESVLLNNEEETLTTLSQLQEMGVRVAMDDFGTGYSSLGCLRDFPFDKIKIDRSFAKDLSANDDAIYIVRAVVMMAAKRGAITTIEGVETEEQLAVAGAEGCTEAQGYLFSRPVPPEQVGDLLRDKRWSGKRHSNADGAVSAIEPISAQTRSLPSGPPHPDTIQNWHQATWAMPLVQD